MIRTHSQESVCIAALTQREQTELERFFIEDENDFLYSAD
jgi:hypothetical protein